MYNTIHKKQPDNLDLSGVGIWIDPIGMISFIAKLWKMSNVFNCISLWVDATNEYVGGVTQRKYPKIATSGLECVTVLIGLYDKGTGKPLGGIINQPFSEQTESG